jgi:hypothetical protein
MKLILLALIVGCWGYEENLGKIGWYLSSASYCRHTLIESWSCGTGCQKAPRIDDVSIFLNSTRAISGFGGYNADRNQIVLVFRGTVPWLIKNWLADIDLVKTNFKPCGDCQVHKGFLLAYE